MLLLLIVFNIIFAYFFYFVGTWYFSLIPIFFTIFLLANLSSIFGEVGLKKIDIKELLVRNLFYIAWGLILIGFYGILFQLKPFALSEVHYIMILVYFNIVANILSYLFDYKDGRYIFHFGYYFSLLILLYQAFISGAPSSDIFNLFLLLIVLTFVFYTFLVFIVSNFVKDDLKLLKQLNFLFFIFFIVIFIYSNLYNNPYLAVLLSQLFLTFLFLFIFYINKYIKNYEPESIELNPIDRILSGKNILNYEKKNTDTKYDLFTNISSFFNEIPGFLKFLLALLNLFLIFVQIYLFISNIGSSYILYYELLYWFGILLFIVNFILLKQINYYYYLQRIFAFFILNFGIYLTILNIFGHDTNYIVIFGILWSIISSLFLFMTKHIMYKKLLFKEDYYVWILSNFITIFINMYFVYQLNIENSLKISIVLVYIGIWLFISFYNIKHIENTFKKI